MHVFFQRMGKYLFAVLVFLPFLAVSQILDDTTKVKYGPRSVRFLKEDDLRFNNPDYQYLDTTIYNTYKVSKPEQSNYYLENLGVEGTPNRYLFYELPDEIGVSPGFNKFQWFFKKPEDFRYYNTRSPYSRLSLYLGGGNRSITDIEFSRSDSVLFNIGFSLRKWAIDKQQAKESRGDKIVESTQYDVYTHIRSKNLKYQLLANFSRTRHIYDANGGIDTTEVAEFYSKDVSVLLNNAVADELRMNLHLYHQYSIRDHLEFYNSIDKYQQRNEFIDDPLGDDAAFFDNFFISTAGTNDSVHYDYFKYEFGLKGSNRQWYYNFYMKNKNFDFDYKYHDLDTMGVDSLINNVSGTERYVGFNASYSLPFGYLVSGGMEYMDDDGVGLYNDNNQSYISVVGKYLDLTYKHAEYKPSFLQQQYIGNHSFWINNFGSVFAQTFRGRLLFEIGPAFISPSFRYDKIKDFIYFAEDKMPAQASNKLYITSPGLQFQIRFLKHFKYEGNVVYTIVEGDTAVKQIPEWFINSRVFYNNIFFQRNLEINIGFDVHYKSPYYGDDFAPDVQQFFIQKHTIVGDFPVVTFFLDFKINRANFILRFNNLWPNFSKSKGYLVAPLYPGLPQLFDFGFNWRFYD